MIDYNEYQPVNLVYSKNSDLFINDDENISDVRLNQTFQKLIENDKSLFNSTLPKIWECSWFNALGDDAQLDARGFGYNKGDSVWYNTEYIDDFLAKNCTTIYQYMRENKYLGPIAVEYDAGNKDVYDLYVSVLKGYDTGTEILQPIFDIGDISGSVQVYVSKIDNNRIPPSWDTEGKYWDTFLKNRSNIVQRILDKLGGELFKLHIEKYHMDQLSSDEVSSTFIKQYLMNDISNVDKNYVQKFTSPVYSGDLSGFDYVVNQGQKVELCDNVTYGLSTEYQFQQKLSGSYYYILSVDSNSSNDKAALKQDLSGVLNYSGDIEPFIDNLADGEYFCDIRYELSSSYMRSSGFPKVVEYSNRHKITEDMKKYYSASYDILSSNLLSTTDSRYYKSKPDVKLCVVYDESHISADEGYYIEDNSISTNTFSVPVSKIKVQVPINWFRQWKSGYLEHGGKVQLDSSYQIVKLNWEYVSDDGSWKRAPVFGYQVSPDSMYGLYQKIENMTTQYQKDNNLHKNQRYEVHITPTGIDNYRSYPNNGKYMGIDVIKQKNDGFDVLTDLSQYTQFTYHAYGFSILED